MSHHYARRRRGFRRSPLSDILTVAVSVILIVLLIYLLRVPKSASVPSSNDSQPSPPASFTPSSPSPSSKPTEIPWNLTLVNHNHPLPEGHSIETANVSNNKKFDARASEALEKMLADCRGAGLSPLVCSAYRTLDEQTQLFQNKIDRLMATGMSHDEAYTAAATVVAIPGTSEHNLGLAADICALSYQNLDDAQANTPEQKWLMAHCTEYGFILRYPQDKGELTGIIFEPWHYRYVGEEAAKEITRQGLCLEEYIQQNYELS